MEKEQSSDLDVQFELQDPKPQSIFAVENLQKDNIVWAARKDLHWPALVRSIDKKNNKVKVWYLDIPGKSFKVSFKKIKEFEDLEFNKKILIAAESNPLGQKHHEVLRRSLLFLFRRKSGIKDDPAVFFDSSKPYNLLREFNHGNTELKFISDNTSSERIGDNLAESSEGESLIESDEENQSITKSLPKLCVENSSYTDELVNKILSCIKAGQVDKHLMDVVNSQIVNERHDLFVEAVKTCKTDRLISSPSYIPIEKLQVISRYLFDLYKQKMVRDKLLMSKYVTSVWLPEAIDKALSLIKTDSLNEPVCASNVSYLYLEEELQEKIIASSSEIFDSENFPNSSKSPTDYDCRVYNQPAQEVNMETQEKPEKQHIASGSKASTIPPVVKKIEVITLSSDSEDSDSIIEIIRIERSSSRNHQTDKNNVEAAQSYSLKQPIGAANVSDLSSEEVKNKINGSSNEEVSCSESFGNLSKTIDYESMVYNPPAQEVMVETEENSEKQRNDCGNKNNPSDMKGSDSTIESISGECSSPRNDQTVKNNVEAAQSYSLKQPIGAANVSDLSSEEVKNKIIGSSNEEVSCSESFANLSETIDYEEVMVETEENSEKQHNDCGNKNNPSDMKDSDSTIESISGECSSDQNQSDENNGEACYKRKLEFETSTPSKKQALLEIDWLDEKNMIVYSAD